jgi:hypothetical protein
MAVANQLSNRTKVDLLLLAPPIAGPSHCWPLPSMCETVHEFGYVLKLLKTMALRNFIILTQV